MKLTVVLVMFFCLQASADGFSQQKISLKFKKTEIADILTSIEKQTSYRFLYNNDLLDLKQKVNLNVQDAELKEVLNLMFTDTDLSYEFMQNNLVVIKSADGGAYEVKAIVTGKVTGENNTALSGVSVQVKGTNKGTVTDAQGVFTINANEADVLVFSYIGYETQEIAVSGKTEINVTMVASNKQLDQVVVVGYGTQRKIDVTGSVTQIKGEEISKQASINPISSLQGKVAGVQITNSGAPGSSPQIRIRGLGTVYGDPNPLYIVDGVWYNDISFLNPADIETLSILKDASAESIYGIRAANGVVLIATKKGKAGQALINYSGYGGWQSVTNQVKMANATEYATLINELSERNGAEPVYDDPASYGNGTDWYHQILRNASVNNHAISLTGGSEKNSYSFSLGYLNQQGVVETNDYTRYTALLRNDFQPFENLKLGYSVTGAFSNSNDIPGGIFHQLFSAAPVVPVYYADGSYGDPNDYNVGDGSNFNPQVTIDFFNQKSKNYRLNGNAYVDLKFLQHFTFHTSVGGEYGESEVRNYLPVYKATLKQQNSTSQLSIQRAETRNWILENTLTYANKFGDHNITVLAGQAAQRYKSYGLTGTAYNVPFNSEGDLYLALGDEGSRNVVDYGDLSTIASYFGRVNYSFKNRYMLNASIRADGSSKFYGDNRWGYFPSVGAGWVISQESFMQNQKIFDYLKLRGSWGKIGNASVPSNLSVLKVTQEPYLTAIYNNQPYTGASITTLVPPTTYWERGVGTDIGLEASFLNKRLSIEADFYNKKTEKAIFDIPVLGSLGTSSGSIVGNQADFQNRGFEFSATWNSSLSKSLSYTIGGNFSINNNKVLSVSTGANPIYQAVGTTGSNNFNTITVVGQPIGAFYGYQVTGVFQSDEDAAASLQSTAKAGDFIYKDQNNDKVIDGKDRIAIGNPNPKFTYGLNTTWNYKQFDLTIDLQGVAGVDIYNANLGLRYGGENFTKDFYDNRWHGQGTSNSYPSANIGGGQNYLANSFYVESGSYFRIRNAQLGYTISPDFINKWKIKKLRVYANAQNALNFFNYKGFSPEIGGTPTRAGVDVDVYPLYATYNFGVNLTF
ncbi:TonB-dependent receptor [Panacibacter ginsenosidivorans]|nr:TonB-dependent receptor [Panacibacter ginsenosidivorans]